MKTVKTAISIDAKVFRRVERLTRRLRISRSQFFTQAARHMINRDENLELLQKINAAYENTMANDGEQPHLKARTYARRKGGNEW
jgi:metal-responsive CopG/Arc/MetJ family transcriptional regulator